MQGCLWIPHQGKGLEHAREVFVGVVAAQHQHLSPPFESEGPELTGIEAEADRDQAAERHAKPAMNLLRGGFGVAEHPGGPMQHQGHISQVIGQQGGGLGKAQRQQVVGQHHRPHASQQRGFRQRRNQQGSSLGLQQGWQLVLGPEQTAQVPLAAMGWGEVGGNRDAVGPEPWGVLVLPGRIGGRLQQGHQGGVESRHQVSGHHPDARGLWAEVAAIEEGEGARAALRGAGHRSGWRRARSHPRNTAMLWWGLSGNRARAVASSRRPLRVLTQPGVCRCRKRQ